MYLYLYYIDVYHNYIDGRIYCVIGYSSNNTIHSTHNIMLIREKRVEGSRNILSEVENVKGQTRKVMSVNVALIQQHSYIPGEVRGSCSSCGDMVPVSDLLIQFYYLFES